MMITRTPGLSNLRLVACVAVVALVSFACSAGAASTTTPTSRPTAPASRAPAPSVETLYDKTADARADIDAALALAKTDGKRVMLDFGADWCPDCHVLAAYLDGTAGRALVEPNFHVVSIDVGYWDHNLDIAGTYGNPIKIGIPAVVVLEPDGSMVGSSADGSLASASGMTEQQVLGYLARWVP
jgi:thiol:disulfide interchange protein